jgi:hypothetical protein
MFSYTINCVTYAEKGSQAEKKLLQRLQGLHMGNVLEGNKCNNLSFFVLD